MDLVKRKSAQSKRASLKKAWNVSGKSIRHKKKLQRAIEKVVRKDKTYNPKRSGLSAADRVLLLREIRPSTVLDGLYPIRRQRNHWQKLRSRDPATANTEIDLEEFSFLRSPQATLDALKAIAQAESRALGARINFKDEYCLDVAPFMLLVECWKEMMPVFEGGEMNLPMQKVLAAVGVQYALGVGFTGISDFNDVWAFPLTRRRKPGASDSKSPFVDVPTRDYATDRFVEAVDEWLGRPEIELELSDSGREKLMNLLGEVLENAERHSDGHRRDGSWSVSGFLAKRSSEAGEPVYRASIGILSLGDTFSESLDRAHTDQKTNISEYITDMKTKGAVQSEETLKTLAALQDGVTCVEEAENADRGGYGLMDILDFVSVLGRTVDEKHAPQVTIISGSSCIQLKGNYNRGHTSGADGPRVQWFNNENSARIPPDPNFVFDLNGSLPGTAISIGFYLDPEVLRRSFDGA
ncbi:hypothetical protein O3S81_13440 [Agrobacterium sp. SOY23]|uniref:hypothetical protein n=1 Tax=Agrobacterium sp. SOY23 TaxID=3014555 RepID=UPI0022AECC13|nr:hypothetical protein [Agrobacterium sp. SOY23]MCZ4430703.1 hypothetical protein [Agrobacterium sp. SOY23]